MSQPKVQASSRRRLARTAGVVGAVAGVVAAGVAAGVTGERLLVRRARQVPDDPYRDEQLDQLPYDDCLSVPGPNGAEVYVEVVEPTDGVDVDPGFGATPTGTSEPTLVFVHGFCLTMGTFHFQRADLTRRGEYRMVFYDQPGHGLSGQRSTGDYTLDELAGTLKAVLDATVPEGPIVLIGHSMGGMTIMAFAEAHPEFMRERVRGVVFMSTSGGRMDEVHFGMPDLFARASQSLMPAIIGSGKFASGLVDGVRRTSTDLTWLLTRRYGFGGSQPSPTVVSYVTKMNSLTGTDVVMRYLRALSEHARYPALEVLRHLSVLVITGDSDQLIPVSHSEEICRLLPDATLVVVPDTGHVPMLEAPEVVNEALRDYLARV